MTVSETEGKGSDVRSRSACPESLWCEKTVAATHFIPDPGQVRGGPDRKPGQFKEGAVTSLLLEASSRLRSQSLVAGVEVLEGSPESSPAGATHLKWLASPALNTGSLAPNNPLG